MKAKQIIGEVYSSKDFTYVKSVNTLSSFITDVPGVLRQLWSDSMDVGFAIRSERTGRVVCFTLVSVDYGTLHVNGEREPLAWVFEPYNPHGDANLNNLVVKIFND